MTVYPIHENDIDHGINYNSNKHLVVVSAAVELAENPGPRIASGCQTGGHHRAYSLAVVLVLALFHDRVGGNLDDGINKNNTIAF